MSMNKKVEEVFVVQIRLLGGETILAQITEEEMTANMSGQNNTLRVFGCLEMLPLQEDLEDMMNGTTEFYLLRPWVTYTDDIMQSIGLNPISVVYMVNPAEGVLNQYHKSIAEIQGQINKNKEGDKTPASPTGTVVSFKPRLITE